MTTRCYHCGDTGVLVRAAGGVCLGERCQCVANCERCADFDRGFVYVLRWGGERGDEVIESQTRAAIARAEEAAAWTIRDQRARNDAGEDVVIEHCYLALRRCVCAAVDSAVRAMNRAQIPALYATAAFDNYLPEAPRDRQRWNQAEVLGQLRELVARFQPGDRGVLLSGSPGVGKTHLLTAVGRQLTLGRHLDVLYCDVQGLVARIREADFKLAGLGEYRKCQVLLVDELGRAALAEREREAIESLVADRYSARKSTFVATNLTLSPGPVNTSRDAVQARTLEEALGPRLSSRLREMCLCLELRGPDWRRRSC